MLYASGWQTVGPYLHIGLNWLNNDNMVGEGVTGTRITIEGVLVDGQGKAVPDGMIELWQANAHGRYNHPEDTQDKPLEPGFTGFARMATDENGGFRFHTIKPGRVPGPDGQAQAPHILVSVFARGVLKRMATRIYFPDDASTAEDPLLVLVPADRRDTLIAKRVPGRDGVYRFNIVIQGDWLDQGETVFFDI